MGKKLLREIVRVSGGIDAHILNLGTGQRRVFHFINRWVIWVAVRSIRNLEILVWSTSYSLKHLKITASILVLKFRF